MASCPSGFGITPMDLAVDENHQTGRETDGQSRRSFASLVTNCVNESPYSFESFDGWKRKSFLSCPLHNHKKQQGLVRHGREVSVHARRESAAFTRSQGSFSTKSAVFKNLGLEQSWRWAWWNEPTKYSEYVLLHVNFLQIPRKYQNSPVQQGDEKLFPGTFRQQIPGQLPQGILQTWCKFCW